MNSPTQPTPFETEAFREDIVHCLSQPTKSVPCKYLYDEVGSKLFDQICDLDEYYPTRTEIDILSRNAESIAGHVGSRVMLVEPGSGSSIKSKIILDSLDDPVAYVPVDISAVHLDQTATRLRKQYPKIEILPVAADFTERFDLPKPSRSYSHVTLFFPGSTIGNFEPDQASQLLENLATMLGKNGSLLIGIDLQKDVLTTEAAYNDAKGITAKFNLNLLERINRELGADIDLSRFEHEARYNQSKHRIEISIVSKESQIIDIGDTEIEFDKDEKILTEHSHKFTVDGFASTAEPAGFQLDDSWTDDDDRFAVLHLKLRP